MPAYCDRSNQANRVPVIGARSNIIKPPGGKCKHVFEDRLLYKPVPQGEPQFYPAGNSCPRTPGIRNRADCAARLGWRIGRRTGSARTRTDALRLAGWNPSARVGAAANVSDEVRAFFVRV